MLSKRICVSSLLLLTTVLGLAGCGGGGPPNEAVSASITGLSASGLALQFNGTRFTVAAGATSQQFGSVTAGSSYSVTVTAQPVQETCTVTGGNGTMPSAPVTVVIGCVLNTYSIGGAATGLTEAGLILLNNGIDATEVKPNTTMFTMNTLVTSGGAYAITIKSQPIGEICSLSDASGNDVLGSVTTVSLQCAPWSSATTATMYSFTGGNDGSAPFVLIQGADSNFYGLSAGVQYVSNGNVFQVTPAGAEKTLYTFAGVSFAPPFPEGPDGLLQGTDGYLYGTTFAGGSANYGTFFRLEPMGTLTALHSFTGGSDGTVPTGSFLKAQDGKFYGTTVGGGGPDNNGAVFAISTTGAESIFSSMSPTSPNSASRAILQSRDGTIYYATAFNNLASSGGGTVYAVRSAGAGTPVYAFNGTSEGSSIGALIEGADGNLYGFTTFGGNFGGGTIFKLTPTGTLTTLHSFGDTTDGGKPNSLILAGNNFYGTTTTGGANNLGTLFRVTPDGAETVLYSFIGTSNGTKPTSLILAADGTLYGLTGDGGDAGLGTIFKVVPH